jgi:putative Holliday junction resolvase
MRVIGIDYGTVRTGIAISDPSAMIAQPAGYIRCDCLSIEELATQIAKKYTEVNAGGIVIGLPKHMSGDEGTHAGKVRELAGLLEMKLNMKVDYLDERLTSVSAEKLLIEGNVSREKRKEKIDSVAACIILQSYLDAKASDQ